MKRINYILFMAFAAGVMASCSEKKQSNVIIAPKPVAQVKKATQKMSGYEQARDVEWVGSTYKVVVKRSSDTELPLVKVDENNKYYDNVIQVRVLRKDGSEFFNRTFKKSDFSEFLDSHTKNAGALLGIVYFAASVGSPDVTSDEYVPLVLKISRMGSVSISKDQVLDTNDGEDKASADGEGNKKASSDDEDEAGV